jgi:zinc/manganese transport system permease protein
MSSLAIGAILSTALLIGPAATGLRVATRPGTAILVAVLVGVTSTWVGILLAYDSFTWPPAGHGWPVSFFIVVLIFVSYLLASLRTPSRRDATTSTPAGHAPAREGRATCSPTT